MCQQASWERLEAIFQEELEEKQQKLYTAFLEEIGWKLAVRDDNRVARALLDREDIHGTYGVHLPGALDGVYHFMRKIGFLDLLLAARPKASIRVMVPIARYILIYLFKGMCVSRIDECPASTSVLQRVCHEARWLQRSSNTKRDMPEGRAFPQEKKERAGLSANCSR